MFRQFSYALLGIIKAKIGKITFLVRNHILHRALNNDYHKLAKLYLVDLLVAFGCIHALADDRLKFALSTR